MDNACVLSLGNLLVSHLQLTYFDCLNIIIATIHSLYDYLNIISEIIQFGDHLVIHICQTN